MLSNRAAFETLFIAPAPDVPQCATLGCDRRPKRGCLHCQCCIDDRRAGRVVVARAADELLPFTVEMERKHTSGPCPMSKGDAGTRDLKRNRKNGKYRRDKFAHPAGDPRKRTGISFDVHVSRRLAAHHLSVN